VEARGGFADTDLVERLRTARARAEVVATGSAVVAATDLQELRTVGVDNQLAGLHTDPEAAADNPERADTDGSALGAGNFGPEVDTGWLAVVLEPNLAVGGLESLCMFSAQLLGRIDGKGSDSMRG
jgi:hypothetical protein